jgi:predicted MFS family arabinose efflux permease
MAMSIGSATARPSLGRSLDVINFLLADVRGAFGPYVNVFLITQLHWTQSRVGLIIMVGGLLGLLAQTPIGWAIDRTDTKRGVLVLALAVLGTAGVILFSVPSFWPVLVANGVMAIVGDVFGPAVAALTLCLFPAPFLPRRMGRNAAFDHAGNIAIALVAAAIGYVYSQQAVFLLAPIFALLAAIASLSIPGVAIDLDRARGLDGDVEPHAGRQQPVRWRKLLNHMPLVVFALSAMLFHFANAPLLPFVGQKLAVARPQEATAMMSSCVIAAQVVMLGVALFGGRKADTWALKPLLLRRSGRSSGTDRTQRHSPKRCCPLHVPSRGGRRSATASISRSHSLLPAA